MASVNDSDDTLWYVHDPMCSWCWAFAPVWRQLRDSLPENLRIRRLVGGLAPDSNRPMPAEMRSFLQQTWRHVAQQVPGTQFNHDFWRLCEPRRSTYPACRAVIAAAALDTDREEAMIEAIQHAYYIEARNPSDDTTLIDIAARIGLDPAAFGALLRNHDTEARLQRDIARARGMGADAFPSLRLETGAGITAIAIDYLSPLPMARSIARTIDQ